MALDLLHEVERQNKIVDRKEKCYIDIKNVMYDKVKRKSIRAILTKSAKMGLKKKKKKNLGHTYHTTFFVLWGFQNMRKMVNSHYPLPNFFANQIHLEYFMRFFPSNLNLYHLAQKCPTALFKKEIKTRKFIAI